MPKTRFLVLFLFAFINRVTKWHILRHPNSYLGDFIQLKLSFIFFFIHSSMVIFGYYFGYNNRKAC